MKIALKIMKWIKTELNSGRLLIALGLIIIGSTAFAQGDSTDLKSVLTGLSSNIDAIKDLILAISQIAGIGFAAAGVVKFKQHKDMPHQVTLSQCLVLFVIGIALVGLPQVAKMVGGSAGLKVDIEKSESGGA